MKKYFFILLLVLISPLCKAQEFYIDQEQLTWQMVYHRNVSIDDIHKQMAYSGGFQNIVKIDDCIFADIKPVPFKPADYGMKRGSSPTILLNGAIGTIHIRIECKEGRYRVTANNMYITDITSGGFSPMGSVTKLDDLVLADGEPNEYFNTVAPVFQKVINSKVTFVAQEEEEW
ncbi:MAG: hypothetical protein IKW20_06530 [Bacteroidales bacterium]|nr:hypothetical protein [Bacteroidales bacterium]